MAVNTTINNILFIALFYRLNFEIIVAEIDLPPEKGKIGNTHYAYLTEYHGG